MARLKYIVRHSIYSVLDLLSMVIPEDKQKTVNIPILVYHSINSRNWFFSVDPEVFRRQMDYLAENFHPVSLARAVSFIKERCGEGRSGLGNNTEAAVSCGFFPAKPVVITFDDGYADFIDNALPVIEQYGMPVSIFVIAGRPNRKELNTDLALLDRSQINRLAKHPLITIGSHTMTHCKLTKIKPQRAVFEIHQSKKILEELTGRPILYLAYPKGSFNREIKEELKKAGYQAGLSMIEKRADCKSDIFSLPRLQVDKTVSLTLFKKKLSRAVDWYYRLRRVFI